MTFKRIRVPGEELIRVEDVLNQSGVDWRAALEP
jgi:hypothetical protein